MVQEKKIGNLLKGAVFRQIADPVTAIEETGFTLVHEAYRRLSCDDTFEAGTIGMRFTCRRLAHCRTHTSSPHVIPEIPDTGAAHTTLVGSSCDAANRAACRRASIRPAALQWPAKPSVRRSPERARRDSPWRQ